MVSMGFMSKTTTTRLTWENMSTATATQIETIRARRVDDVAREIMRSGVTLSHEQADALGGEALAWMASRLSLSVTETDAGVECSPCAREVQS